MADVGIARICITDSIAGRGAWRFNWSRARHPAANHLYRRIFAHLGTPLLPGEKEVECSKEEFAAGFDYALGIDVVLTLSDGREMTLQEKFLRYPYSTVTVEYMQDHRTGEQGDWFNMKAQLYFVGYDRSKTPGKMPSFQDWILLNWPSTQMESSIPWQTGINKNDGARSNFRWAYFSQFPDHCVVAVNTANCHWSLRDSPKVMTGVNGKLTSP